MGMPLFEIGKQELFDNSKQEFITIPGKMIEMEHSLYSIKKWESKWQLPFLKLKKKTIEQFQDYVKFMCKNPEDEQYIQNMTNNEANVIAKYLSDPQSATRMINLKNTPGKKQPLKTAEIFYYQMVALNIPWEAQYWNFNQLSTFIKMVDIESTPKNKRKKMTVREATEHNVAILNKNEKGV